MTQVNFRIDDKVKQDADELFDNLGLSLSAAITIFLKRAISRRGFPFPVAEDSAGVSLGMYHCNDVQTACVSVADEKIVRQKTALKALAGSWKDDRTTAEIIKDIESHRTKGRKVEL